MSFGIFKAVQIILNYMSHPDEIKVSIPLQLTEVVAVVIIYSILYINWLNSSFQLV